MRKIGGHLVTHMFEYIRSPDIYRATSLFAFTVLAYKKHPLGALSCPGSLVPNRSPGIPGLRFGTEYQQRTSEYYYTIEHYTRRGKIGGKIREIMP